MFILFKYAFNVLRVYLSYGLLFIFLYLFSCLTAPLPVGICCWGAIAAAATVPACTDMVAPWGPQVHTLESSPPVTRTEPDIAYERSWPMCPAARDPGAWAIVWRSWAPACRANAPVVFVETRTGPMEGS